ncbi:MAG: histidine kinase [Desulfobacteraceae bacterium]|nr:histidine kinase [Desulfobacteraceae bacterium]
MKIFFGMQNKFITATSLFIVIFTAVVGYLLVNHESRLYTEDAVNQAKTIAGISGVIFTNALVYKELGLVEDINFTDYLDYYVSDLMQKDRRIAYMIVLDPSGKVLSHSDIKEHGKIYTDTLTKQGLEDTRTTVRETMDEENGLIADVTAPLRISTKNWGVCRIGFYLSGVEEKINMLKNGIISIMSLVLIFSLMIIGIAGKALATPLVKLAGIMDQITEKRDIKIQVPEFPLRRDEVGMLQNSFSWMLRKLREAAAEKEKTMDRMIQAEKMATVGNLAAGVAHEINNPLGGVVLCFKNVVKGDLDQEAKELHIDVINSGLGKIQNTVEELLNYSRKSPIRIEQTSVNDIIKGTLRLVENAFCKKDIEIVKKLDPLMPMVPLDPNRIEQVFMNIIINAGDAMGDRGTLKITTGTDQGLCLVSISNTGPEIPPEVLSNIFEPFFTTKDPGKGTGLGLAVCKAIVGQHGGMIDVVSKKGKGVEFQIRLPREGI